jgi:hypothetical protein
MRKVERYGPGEHATDVEPGDFILAHRNRLIGNLISLAERRRFRGPDASFAHWSHAAIAVDRAGRLVEDEMKGVVSSPLSKYRDREYHLVRLGVDFDAAGRERAVAYAKGQIGQAFGFLDLFGAAVYLLTGWPLRLVRRDHQICSVLVVRALQAGGQLKELDPVLTLPADLAKYYGVRP